MAPQADKVVMVALLMVGWTSAPTCRSKQSSRCAASCRCLGCSRWAAARTCSTASAPTRSSGSSSTSAASARTRSWRPRSQLPAATTLDVQSMWNRQPWPTTTPRGLPALVTDDDNENAEVDWKKRYELATRKDSDYLSSLVINDGLYVVDGAIPPPHLFLHSLVRVASSTGLHWDNRAHAELGVERQCDPDTGHPAAPAAWLAVGRDAVLGLLLHSPDQRYGSGHRLTCPACKKLTLCVVLCVSCCVPCFAPM